MSGVQTLKSKIGGWSPPFLRRDDAGAASAFSRTFRQGMFYGAILLALLGAWMVFRADDTALSVQSKLPSKMAVIEVPEAVHSAVPATEDGPSSAAQDHAAMTEPTADALPAAPIEGLFEDKDGKRLPIIRQADEMSPFQAYRRPFTAVAGRPKVAFVMVDFGLSDKISEQGVESLPPDVTFVLNPYAADVARWADAARAHGHETWMALPMQDAAVSADMDTGPLALVVDGSIEENKERLETILGSAVGYAGVVTRNNHHFSDSDMNAAPILNQMFSRGIGFAESTVNGISFGAGAAQDSGQPYVKNDFWLDFSMRPDDLQKAFHGIESSANKNGRMVVFFHPYPVLVKAVADWSNGAADKGFQIAPLSALAE